MSNRTLMVLAVVLTGIFLFDTGLQVYHLTQGKPAEWYALALLLPITHLLKKLSDTRRATAADPQG